MPSAKDFRAALGSARGAGTLRQLYGDTPAVIENQKARYALLLDRFSSLFPEDRDMRIYSTPGRTEVGGNHTDHNAGRVLAAAVNLDAVAVAARSSAGRIVVESEGYPRQEIRVDDLARRDSEAGTAQALTRGVAARMKELGHQVGGFHACVTSSVLKGSGLSSSASYEVLIATIINGMYNAGRMGDLDIAMISQYAENRYFGKPCGLMDQTTCAAGGFVAIDFKDFASPAVRKVPFDFAASGFSLVIVDTGGSHADLTEDYAAIEREMKDVARVLGGKVLRDVTRERVLAEMPSLRRHVNDRAILRALHFFADDARVAEQVAALEAGRFDVFLGLVVESGRSSWMLLQNCYPHAAVGQQGIAIGLAASEAILEGSGAWRVHGGGFAGTIQAFVPASKHAAYLQAMRALFGPASCHDLLIRPVGTTMLDLG
jgi:galactokinase